MKPHAKKTCPILTRDEARDYLVGHLGLRRRIHKGKEGVRRLLRQLRCIQLDPLDPWGTNADLVALARVDGIRHGDIYRHLYPGHAFEHFAKEQCLLPASAFPYYRQRAIETPWWRHSERWKRVSQKVVDSVLEEIRAHGPLSARALTDHGKVEPLSWHGWKSTSRATKLALEILWTRCEVVVCGRQGRARKVYDVPERALSHVSAVPAGEFERWAVLERVEAAGLLCRAGGPHWSVLSKARTSELPDKLVEEGLLEEVQVEGSPRRYLAPAGFRKRRFPRSDGKMRILAPLDPVLWDRNLVQDAFGFHYVWEVYKPAALRLWGWYVCPLLHNDRLVGRIEGSIDGKVLRVTKIWREGSVPLDNDALDEALEAHSKACGTEKVIRPRRILKS